MSKQIIQNTIDDLTKLREISPLVHNITNYVVMNNTANALLAIGASPIMAHAIEEVEEMVTICSATVINIGTLSEPWIQSMEKAASKATSLKKPLILDPVGAGASNLRNSAIKRILNAGSPTIIRGNASEILSTLSSSGKTKGVDATDSSESAIETGKSLAGVTRGTVVISGVTDYILNQNQKSLIQNGDALMTKVTGLGCTASSLCGAFAAVQTDSFRAATSAMAVMGIAGEMAVAKTKSPGSFQIAFLDALYELNADQIQKHLKGE
ncbi:hydroxyethylthiazole kinase [Leptospira sp. 96542]|nr:hydroxyethylthiazole kinase [Leptospira sp. 96542]